MKLRFDKTAAWHPSGLKVVVSANHTTEASRAVYFQVESLNPQQRIVYCGSRWELIRLGIWIALRAFLLRA
jgi:hypothetical protein